MKSLDCSICWAKISHEKLNVDDYSEVSLSSLGREGRTRTLKLLCNCRMEGAGAPSHKSKTSIPSSCNVPDWKATNLTAWDALIPFATSPNLTSLSMQRNLAFDRLENPSKDKLTVLDKEVEFLRVNLIKNIRPTNAGCSKDIVIDRLLPSEPLSNQSDTLQCRYRGCLSLTSFQRTQTDGSERTRTSEEFVGPASTFSRRSPMNE